MPKESIQIRSINTEDHNYDLPEWNLICERGHLSYSPEPMTWVGHECGIRFVSDNTGKRTTCRKKQVLLKDYKPKRIPKKPEPKKKKPKWKVRKKLVPRY